MPTTHRQRGELTKAALRLLRLLPTGDEFATAEEIIERASASGWRLAPDSMAPLLRQLRRLGLVIARPDDDQTTWSATPTGVTRRAA